MRLDRPQWLRDEATVPQGLGFGTTINDFWTTRPLRGLAEAQSVGVLAEVEDIRDESVSDEETEAFISALGL